MIVDARFWDRLAPKYAKSPIRNLSAYRYSLERTRSYLKSDDRVLEFGCGTGSTAIALARNVKEVVATDISAAMLNFGGERALEAGVSNIRFLQSDVQSAPKGQFDVVMAFNLLHLLPDLDAALDCAAQRLKKSGLFIAKTPCLGEARGTWRYRMIRIAIPLARLAGKAPDHVELLDIRKLETAVKRAGFDIIEAGNYPADTPSRYLVARRV